MAGSAQQLAGEQLEIVGAHGSLVTLLIAGFCGMI